MNSRVFANIHLLNKSNILVLLFSFAIFLTQYTTLKLSDPGYLSYASLSFIGIISSIFLLVKLKKIRRLNVNLIDASFVCLHLLIILRWIFTPDNFIYSKGVITVAAIPIYVIVRNIKSITLIHWAIVLSGFFQAIVYFMQKLSFLPNTNPSFQAGGTLGNPNVVAMVLLITLFSSIYLIKRSNQLFIKYLLFLFVITAIVIIFDSKCRTTLLGLILAGGIIAVNSKFSHRNIRIKTLLLTIISASSILFVFLLLSKSASLYGRLLIWKSSFYKLSENIMWGHGISTFHKIYPDGQRQFFTNHDIPPIFHEVAGTPDWAYNDFLELWVEGGILIAISFLFLFCSIVYCWKSEKRFNINGNNILFVSSITFFVFGSTNFAFNVWPVFLLFIISLAGCSRQCKKAMHFESNLLKIYYLVGSFIFCGNILVGYKCISHLAFQHKFASLESYSDASQKYFFEQYKDHYWNYTPFAFSYAQHLQKNGNGRKSIIVLEKINQYMDSYYTNYQLAEAYIYLNELENAKKYYYKAIGILPKKISPYCNIYLIDKALNNNQSPEIIRNILNYSQDKENLQLNKSLKKEENKEKISINEFKN